jgi:hypothetical protein
VRQFKNVFNENETGQTQNMTGKGYTIRMDGTAEICIGGIEIKGISPFVNDAPFLPFSVSASSVFPAVIQLLPYSQQIRYSTVHS